jgi:hypothetical protein
VAEFSFWINPFEKICHPIEFSVPQGGQNAMGITI